MTTAELSSAGPDTERVRRWRLDSLREAGYDPQAAWLLAGRTAVDLHRAVDLVRRGCPAKTALRILL